MISLIRLAAGSVEPPAPEGHYFQLEYTPELVTLALYRRGRPRFLRSSRPERVDVYRIALGSTGLFTQSDLDSAASKLVTRHGLRERQEKLQDAVQHFNISQRLHG